MMGIKLFTKQSIGLSSDKRFPSAQEASVNLRASVISGDEAEKIDVSETASECKFGIDKALWEQETAMLSVNNFENSHFEAIVKMGEEAVPFIYEQLKKGDTPLVHALERIYPDKVKYKGFISLSQARRIWLKILKKQIES